MARRLVFVLVGWSLPSLAAAAPFVLECPDPSVDRPYHLTVDLEAKSALFRSWAGSVISGTITSAEGGRMFITLPRGYRRDYELVWDETRKTLTWLDDPGDPTRREVESRCEVKAP
ncbi:MAG: hypothetical protein WCE79_11730 [Xanthobacteraceae bacterium]